MTHGVGVTQRVGSATYLRSYDARARHGAQGHVRVGFGRDGPAAVPSVPQQGRPLIAAWAVSKARFQTECTNFPGRIGVRGGIASGVGAVVHGVRLNRALTPAPRVGAAGPVAVPLGAAGE